MTERDKLKQVIEKAADEAVIGRHVPLTSDVIADAILEDGWIRPPVKLGQKVYNLHYGRIREWQVCYIGFNGDDWFINVRYFKDKYDFATRQFQGRYFEKLFFNSEEELKNALEERKTDK